MNLQRTGVPSFVLGVLEALHFEGASNARLRGLTDAEWQKLLPWCDARQLTLMLPSMCGDALPAWVRERISGNTLDFEDRLERLKRDLREIREMLNRRGIEFVVLKGFTHSPDLTPDAVWRAQGDIDLWCAGETAAAAWDALIDAGYISTASDEGRHLAPLIRGANWEWRGNRAGIPIAVELHHTLWNGDAERIHIPGQDEYWDRREQRDFDGVPFSVLRTEDLLAFAALHLFLHLIHGDLPLQRAWEIANFLHNHADDEAFWESWRRLHSAESRQIQVLIFALARTWFGCRLADSIDEAISLLPDGLQLWLGEFAFSPLKQEFRPNKDEVWLHLALIPSFQGKARVLAKRLFPVSLPAYVDKVDGKQPAAGPPRLIRQSGYVASRLRHHASALPPALFQGLKWFWRRQSFGPGFPRFLAAYALFDIGEFLFLLLYNLYLLESGFREDALGLISGAMTAGTLGGTPIAASFVRRFGLRTALIVAALGGGLTTLARVSVSSQAGLVAAAALSGIFFSFWAVAFAPAVAGMSREKNRAFAFSLTTCLGIGIGVIVGLVGGHLPRMFEHSVFLLSSLAAKRVSIWIGCLFIALAAIPASGLKFAPPPQHEPKVYPRGKFVRHFLAALFLWVAATSSFNSFFTVYFARHVHLGLERIGLIFSSGQLCQIVAILLAPLVLQKLGESRGIAAMQSLTALFLLFLAFGPLQIAAFAYIGYVAFQYMSEPGLFSLLMNRVNPGERTGASAAMFLVMSLSGSIAVFFAGTSIARFGYAPSIAIGACLACVSALLFGTLPRGAKPELD